MENIKSKLEKIHVDYIINGGIKKNLKLEVYNRHVEVKGNVLNKGIYSHAPTNIINMANNKLRNDFPKKIITFNLLGRNYLLR